MKLKKRMKVTLASVTMLAVLAGVNLHPNAAEAVSSYDQTAEQSDVHIEGAEVSDGASSEDGKSEVAKGPSGDELDLKSSAEAEDTDGTTAPTERFFKSRNWSERGKLAYKSWNSGKSSLTLKVKTFRKNGYERTGYEHTDGVKLGLFEHQNSSYPMRQCGYNHSQDCVCTVEAGGECTIDRISWLRKGYVYAGVVNYTGKSEKELSEVFDEIGTGSTSDRANDGKYRYKVYKSGTIEQNDLTKNTEFFAAPLKNPQLSVQCSAGLKVALVVDYSGSVVRAGQIDNLTHAQNAVIDSLKNTTSYISIFPFGSYAPHSKLQELAELYKLNDSLQYATVKRTIQDNGRIAKYYRQEGTNWDGGLNQVLASGNTYDLVIMLTDGSPTNYLQTDWSDSPLTGTKLGTGGEDYIC